MDPQRTTTVALVLLLGLFLMSWGITTVTPRLAVPDASASAFEALLRLLNDTPFLPNFRKGGNLHSQLLTLIFWPRYVSLLSESGTGTLTEKIRLVGSHMSEFLVLARLLSLIAGVTGLVLLLRTGRRLFGDPAGSIAGLVISINLLYVEFAHAGTEDMLSTTFVILVIYCLVSSASRESNGYLGVAGVAGGLAISAKATAGLIVLPLFYVAYRGSDSSLKQTLKRVAGLAGWIVTAYLMTTPTALLMPLKYLTDVLGEVSNRWAYKGFEATHPGHVIQLLNLARAFSLPLFLGLSTSIVVFWQSPLEENQKRFLRLSLLFVVPHFAVIGTWDTLKPDYVLPLIPWLVLMAAGGFTLLLQRTRWKRSVLAIGWVLVAFATGYTTTVVARYPEDSRLRAQTDVEETVPDSATIGTFSPVQYLPVLPDGVERANLNPNLFGRDEPGNSGQKIRQRLVKQNPDYLILVSSHYDRYMKHPGAYPGTTHVLRKLLREKNRYEIERTFGRRIMTHYSLGTYVTLTWTPRPFHPVDPTLVILKRR